MTRVTLIFLRRAIMPSEGDHLYTEHAKDAPTFLSPCDPCAARIDGRQNSELHQTCYSLVQQVPFLAQYVQNAIRSVSFDGEKWLSANSISKIFCRAITPG